MGLLPLKADPRLFEYPSPPSKTSTGEDEVSDQDTLRYEIKVVCKWNQHAPKDSRRPDDIYCGNNGTECQEELSIQTLLLTLNVKL